MEAAPSLKTVRHLEDIPMQGCRPLSEEEISQVTQAFDGPFALRNQALLLLDVRTGYRISELLSLRVGDVYQRG
jgi:integrase